jgi:hypothetical protein
MFVKRVGRTLALGGTVAALAVGALFPAVAAAGHGGAGCANGRVPLVIVPGDLDQDGDVDIWDYSIVVRDFGQSGPGLQGDANGDGRVDETDYNIVVSNFGFHSPCR